MVTCEVLSITAGGIPEPLVMGDEEGDVVTAEVKGDSPSGAVGRQRSVWSQNTSAGLPVQ